ncbi:MAG: Na+/H+ antiporter NhaC family protein [Alphaproteobacteria bacterium]|nr:Na+/H+ antiporter NhaC family protein [Alphaproteobacteria bacterium]MDP3531708.1 Na+/H+ antiporter NhaC family protein [Alphaproteobacteria bacterium]
MDKIIWLSILPPLLTIVIAIWCKKIIPSLLIGLLVGGYFIQPSFTGGFEIAVNQIVKILTDKANLQVILFLYLFSGLISLIKKSGGIKAFSDKAQKHIKSKNGVFFTLWSLIPVTFIDCGFRVVGAGSITRSLAEKNGIAKERLAFMLNNTASPVVELIPFATTFVGFNVAIIVQGLKAAGVEKDYSAYSVLLQAIPLEFFSIVVIAITFLSIFFQFTKPGKIQKKSHLEKGKSELNMSMNMEDDKPVLKPRMINLIVPILSIICLSIFFFWFFGENKSNDNSIMSSIANTDPNKAMLISLFISIIISAILYFFQKYKLNNMTADIISGGNEIMPTLVILTLAWSLAAVSQDLGLSDFIQQQLGNSLPTWCVAALLFIISSAVAYFIGSSWGTASLIMPFAIPLAVSIGSYIPLCVAAVITGGTFGDVTSPVAGMTNMSSNIVHADHSKYIKYANPYNFLSAVIAAVLFLIVGLF